MIDVGVVLVKRIRLWTTVRTFGQLYWGEAPHTKIRLDSSRHIYGYTLPVEQMAWLSTHTCALVNRTVFALRGFSACATAAR